MHKEEIERKNAQVLENLKKRLEGMPPRGAHVDIDEVWRREFSTHTEIKLTFDGEPGERIPAYLLLPRKPICVPTPAIYAAHQCGCLCDIGKEQVVGKCPELLDQAYGLELACEGFVVLAPDTNKAGERCDLNLRQPWERAVWKRLPDGRWGQDICCCAPGGPAGPIRWKSVYDVMRGIDLLEQLGQVDPARIGMIGHSMGACIMLSSMAFDKRIRVGVSSCGGFNGEDGLSIMAPRPIFLTLGLKESFPGCKDNAGQIQRMKQEFSRAKEEYSALGCAEALSLFEFEGGHVFPEDARKAAYAWFKRWLMELLSSGVQGQ
jgi:hypothetical protein